MNYKTAFDSDPEVLSRIDSLNINATKLVDGLLSGHHRSRHKGPSVEFAEYKDYTPGDEIKHIDWKVVESKVALACHDKKQLSDDQRLCVTGRLVQVCVTILE